MANGCRNSGPYDQSQPQTHCAIVPAANSNPHQAAAQATADGAHDVMKHLGLAGGRRCERKTGSMRGGDFVCPAAVPPGSSSWPTFPNQNGPFSTSQNANTASQTNNALSASTRAQAMYDHEASNIPSGLEGTPQAGGSRRRKSIAKRKRKRQSRRRTRRQRKGGKRSRVCSLRRRTKRRTRGQRKGRTRRHRGGHQDRWRAWGCSSGGGGHRGSLWTFFRGSGDMLRHKAPYP